MSATRHDWHAMTTADCLKALDAKPDGLDAATAARRAAEHGPNQLPPAKRRTLLVRFLLQFHNMLIYILIVAAFVTAVLGHWLDSAVILGVVVVNAVIGVIQEGKAEKALDAIRDMLSPRAMVLRDGERRECDADGLVPGDIVLLRSGDRVPADLRLLKVRDLRVEEAALTGESVAVSKAHDAVIAGDAPLGDRVCMAYSSTLVRAGTAMGVVVGIGADTEIGRISQMIADVEQITTPLLRQMASFGKTLAAAVVLIAMATFAVAVLLRGYPLADGFMAAVGLAVAAIPEGLPAIMTVTLAIGVQRMAARNAIIRHLPAVETLGSVTVICSDKTGTLTRNEMTVTSVLLTESVLSVTGIGYGPEGEIDGHDGLSRPSRSSGCCTLAPCATTHGCSGRRRVTGIWRATPPRAHCWRWP
jgi:magnesium-transporting ATPase (P-type)